MCPITEAGDIEMMKMCEIYERAEIGALPVYPIETARAFGIKTVSYSDVCEIYCRSRRELYRMSLWGFSYEENGQRIIAVNELACGERRRRFTIAHELGHCLLGHVSAGGSAKPDSAQERAADRFAADLLAPVAVLRMCGISSAEELARVCGISRSAAEIRFAELMRSGGISEDELRVIMRFSGFVNKYLQCRSSANHQINVYKRY